jgi:pimeloyl-ACP methyl ester carboxylesterase
MPIARLNGIEINYEVHGQGTPLVLAHGYTASLEMWRQQVPGFSAKYRLVIYDMRGHGKSTAPSDPSQYDLARDYAGDQLALMDHLGIERAHVGGLSMGGMIAQEFALQHPKRLLSLVLCDTGPGGTAMLDPAAAARFRWMRGMMREFAGTGGMAAVVDAMRTAGRFTGMMPPAVDAYIENLRNMSVDGYVGGATAMQTWHGTLDRLGEIRVPTLVLVGERDRLLPASRRIYSSVRGSRFVLLRNAGHGTCVWRPRAFERVVLEFLADADAGRPVAGEMAV